MQTLSAAFVIVVVFLGATDFTDAAVGRALSSNAAYPGKCVIDKDTILSPGETMKSPIHQCASLTCEDNLHVQLQTCAAKAPPKGCKLRDFVNTNRPYPECCERQHECSKFSL